MGCCVSKTDRDQSEEEEKVKEVLSETPNPRRSANVDEVEDIQLHKKKISAELVELTCKNRVNYYDVERSEELSEVSGAASSTTAISGAGEDYEITMQPTSSSPSAVKYRKKRSVSAELGTCRRGRCTAAGGGGGGSARTSPSPGRKRDNAVGRTLSARATTTATGCGFAAERLTRKSVSPAAKRGAAAEQRLSGFQCRANGRASPVQRAQLGVQPAVAPNARCRKLGGEEDGIDGGEKVDEDGKESLENPLVSLECFIFIHINVRCNRKP